MHSGKDDENPDALQIGSVNFLPADQTKIKPVQTKSNQIKPNQTKSGQIRPNQAKSNQIRPNQTS
jgi:hypothetical protein